MRNLWDLPLGRIEIYCQPFNLPEGYYKVSPQASCNGADWIGLERYLTVIEETIPFRLLNKKEHLSLLWNHLRGQVQPIDQTVCVLIDHLNRKPNFFHWFLDALPRLFAAEAHEKASGQPVSIVVPETLQPWQWDSLRLMGMEGERIIQIPREFRAQGCSFSHLVTTFSHRHIRSSSTGHFDALSPKAVDRLATRMIQGMASWKPQGREGRRLYISRGDVSQRRVVNEQAVMDFLSPHGFQRVSCEKLSLQSQIQLFNTATHIIAPHGGALTNLLYLSEGCKVLEVFQAGHGIRPDFFQLAALKKAQYSFALAPSLNANHDIEIPEPVLRTFLEASL
jgi:capsular polysaccharide biosynthesis protein